MNDQYQFNANPELKNGMCVHDVLDLIKRYFPTPAPAIVGLSDEICVLIGYKDEAEQKLHSEHVNKRK